MKYSVEIGKIIEGSINYDFAKVRNYTSLLIEKLKKDGDSAAAKKFERIFESSGKSFVSFANVQTNAVPIDPESKIKLADVYYPSNNNYITVLNNRNEKEVEMFISSILHSDELNKLGLDGGNSLLLFGPPGCGKTNCAFMIAKQLNYPIVVARLDSLISSYLGTTSKNIRLLFDYVSKTPCVLFLDEFDAIAKARDDKNELGELKRVVNTLLQNIDAIHNNSVVIAATNHAQLLDSAVWRRFEYKIQIDKPDHESRNKLIKMFLEGSLSLTEKECNQFSSCLNNETGSSIKEIIFKTLKRCVLNNLVVTKIELYNDIFEKSFNKSINTITTKEKILYLYSRNSDGYKCFTYSDIANILNVSKPYVSMVMRGEKHE